MLNKCWLLVVLSTLSTVGMKAAAVVTCSQPGFSQTVYNSPCAVGSSSDTLVYLAFTESFVSGNTFSAEALAEAIGLPNTNPGPYPMSAVASWNDIFDVPSSNPTDVFKITVFGGGLNHPASIFAGPIHYTTPDFCDADYLGNPACTDTATVSATQPLSVQLTGSDSLTIPVPCGFSNCGLSVNANLYESVSVQRFLADGVTPDPFTTAPEPASVALFFLGLPAGLALYRRR